MPLKPLGCDFCLRISFYFNAEFKTDFGKDKQMHALYYDDIDIPYHSDNVPLRGQKSKSFCSFIGQVRFQNRLRPRQAPIKALSIKCFLHRQGEEGKTICIYNLVPLLL